MHQIQEFTTGLREASIVRDALVKRRDELAKSLVQQHSFTFGLPHAGTGADIAQRLNLLREQGAIEDSLKFWLDSFPLLTRLDTKDIETGSVEAKLREIKANIVSTRSAQPGQDRSDDARQHPGAGGGSVRAKGDGSHRG